MVTIESFCEGDIAGVAAQPSVDQQRALRKAMRHAAQARHELDQAIYRAAEATNASSSSESDNELANHGGCRHKGKAGRHHHHHMHGSHAHHHYGPHGPVHLGRHGIHHHPMTGRHMRGFDKFPGMMRHHGGGYAHPHHPPHAHLHAHPHHPHHQHHHRGHSIGQHGSHWGQRAHAHGHGIGHGHKHGIRQFGIGHASGHGGRAHSCPMV